MLTQYQLQGCPFALRTRIVLHEKSVPFEAVQMDRKNKPAEVLAVSPQGTSPVIFDGPVRLRSSDVINEYLEDRHPEPPLMPKDPGEKAQARLFIEEVSADVGEATGELVALIFRTPEKERDATAIAEARAELLEVLEPFEARLDDHRFLMGEAFTLADIALYTQIRGPFRMLNEDLPPSFPALRAWRTRVESRPAVQKALAEETQS
jgi:glutathione S-transferase